MTKFELPEKPKKTNTSEDFNNLRKAVDELDKFDYTWKTYANKADRRINAANKYIEDLERENQNLKADYNNQAESILLMLKEISTLKSQHQQQALPVVPECVAEWIEHCKGMGYSLIAALTFKLSSTMHEELSAKILKWLENEGNDETFAIAFITGKYEVEKPQLFYLKAKELLVVGDYDHVEDLWLDCNKNFTPKKQYAHKFTQQEIDSMQTGSYEKIEVPVED